MKQEGMVKIAIAGANGRMGKAIIEAAQTDPLIDIVALFDSVSAKNAAYPVPVMALANLPTVTNIQVLIDFTVPNATLSCLDSCCRNKIGMVIGTTGFNKQEYRRLQQAAQEIPILAAQNMSIGINAMYAIVEKAVEQLQAGRLGGGYDIEIFEAHHRYKKDAPSGTALKLGETIAMASGGHWPEDAVFSRHGRDYAERDSQSIGFSVMRGGDIIGEHKVIFAGAGEQIEITHRSGSRTNYATGALKAAKFIASRNTPKFYDNMQEVLTNQN